MSIVCRADFGEEFRPSPTAERNSSAANLKVTGSDPASGPYVVLYFGACNLRCESQGGFSCVKKATSHQINKSPLVGMTALSETPRTSRLMAVY